MKRAGANELDHLLFSFVFGPRETHQPSEIKQADLFTSSDSPAHGGPSLPKELARSE